jgi:hypothetical protein
LCADTPQEGRDTATKAPYLLPGAGADIPADDRCSVGTETSLGAPERCVGDA